MRKCPSHAYVIICFHYGEYLDFELVLGLTFDGQDILPLYYFLSSILGRVNKHIC